METIIATAISVLVSMYLTFLGIKYSSRFHIKKQGKAKEKYVVIEKNSHATKEGYIDSARVALTKSSLDNAMGFMDISLTEHPENIVVDRYAFIHSFIHNVFAPGKTILNKQRTWEENTSSNQFDSYIISSKKLDTVPVNIIAEKIRKKVSLCRAIESEFSYPETYTGPRYKRRLLLIAKGIGIVHSETEYINGDKDTYSLSNYKVIDSEEYWFPVNTVGNFWEYEISYKFGANALNLCP